MQNDMTDTAAARRDNARHDTRDNARHDTRDNARHDTRDNARHDIRDTRDNTRGDTLLHAIEWLAEVLEQENQALASMDVPAALRFVSDKQSALAAFGSNSTGPASPGVKAAAERLRSLAAENRTLLERALVVQNRIIGIVARAIPTATAPRYGANGGFAVSGRPQAYALSARA